MPRDLFNEANLLKCFGQLTLAIENGATTKWPELTVVHYGKDDGWVIDQDQADGSIYCVNLMVSYKMRTIALSVPLNSRMRYPMLFQVHNSIGRVFDNNGVLSEEFIAMLDSLKEQS